MRHFFAGCGAAAIALACIALPHAQAVCGGCVPAHYWRVDPDDYKQAGAPSFPEQALLADRLDVGLAFSGGGTRSASATVGELRGLQRLGWLSRVRYVSAVSGGSWASVPLVFSQVDIDELLGTVDDFAAPSFNAETFLKTANGRLAAAIAKSSLTSSAAIEAGTIAARANKDKGGFLLAAFLQISDHLRRDPDRVNKTYTRLIAHAFIDPLITPGSNTSDAIFSWDRRTLGAIPDESRNELGNVLLAHTGRPFLIASGTMVLDKRDGSFPQLMPVEYTPWYVGVRQTFGMLGGGYVDPWAYDPAAIGAATPAAGQPWTGTLDVRFDTSRHFSLADIAASSGAAPELLTITGGPVPEDYRGYVQQGAEVFPAFRHIGIQGDGATASDEELPHADGGASDNLGIMPLLARQTHNVLVFINTNNRYWASNDDLRSLFTSIGPPSSDGDKRFNAVLESGDPAIDAYTDVIAAFDRAGRDHQPLVYCGKNWTVRGNEHYNIRGYTGLNVCFLYNATPQAWVESLPAPLKADVSHEKDFPWFATFEQDKPHVIQLKPAQVNLLASMWAWTMTQPAIVRLFRDSMPVLPCPASFECR